MKPPGACEATVNARFRYEDRALFANDERWPSPCDDRKPSDIRLHEIPIEDFYGFP